MMHIDCCIDCFSPKEVFLARAKHRTDYVFQHLIEAFCNTVTFMRVRGCYLMHSSLYGKEHSQITIDIPTSTICCKPFDCYVKLGFDHDNEAFYDFSCLVFRF